MTLAKKPRLARQKNTKKPKNSTEKAKPAKTSYANFAETAVIKSLTTIGDCIEWAVGCFSKYGLHFGHGTDNAWDEAVYLILETLELPLNSSRTILKRKLSAAEKRRVAAAVKQRVIDRKPTAYLTHRAYFAGLEFYVDERVLIPRSPIAELIERQFAPWIDARKVKRILDIGTGSGCIAIACAYAFPQAKVDAVDISSQALEVAAINVKKHKKGKQVSLIKSDLFAKLACNEGERKGRCGGKFKEPKELPKYDIIISNPPYVSVGEMQTLPPEYKHEPSLALEAGRHGLMLVDRLLHEAASYLTKDGILVVEVGNSAAALVKTYPHVPFVWIEFARGESEVFLLDAADLAKFFGRGGQG